MEHELNIKVWNRYDEGFCVCVTEPESGLNMSYETGKDMSSCRDQLTEEIMSWFSLWEDEFEEDWNG